MTRSHHRAAITSRSTAALPVAFRAYVESVPPRPPFSKTPPRAGWPDSILILDTETTTDPTQALLFGSYRFGHWGPEATFECLEEGLFYADDLSASNPEGFACLQAYVRNHVADTANPRRPDLLLLSRRDFVNKRLWTALEGGALIVGYNLPFDVTRLAIDANPALGRMFAGGFSIPLFEYRDHIGEWHENKFRPRFRVKVLDSKRALMGVTKRKGAPEAERKQPDGTLGRFLDLKALVFALTDKHLSLDHAAARFGLAARKHVVMEHGRVTAAYLDYNRQDVALTAALLEAVRAEWDRHPVTLEPDKVLSPASVAKGYLRALGLTPPGVKFAVPPEFLGTALMAYYGGRTEVRVRRVPVPVRYLDFRSMYPTVNTLLGLWRLLSAAALRLIDATADVQAWAATVTLERCFNPEFWTELRVFVQIRPAGAILPVRAQYDAAAQNTSIGVNPLADDQPVWVSGPDLVASWVLTSEWPEVIRAVRLVPEGQQTGLTSVALRGAVPIDPTRGDVFRGLIEARAALKGRADFPGEERERLDRFLKVLANSGSYGIFAELNVQPPEHDTGDDVLVYGGGAPFPSRTKAPEAPGEFCFPPFAALTTAGARLMLALLERAVRDRGGVIAFGDTDSAAIVALPDGGLVPCPGGPEVLADGTAAVRALSYAKVEEIRQLFAALNPYDPTVAPGSILKLEVVNEQESEDGPLMAFAISAKRYALYRRTPDGRIRIIAAKEHGLGHLLNPIDVDATDRQWIVQVWEALIREAHGEPLRLPGWVDRPAVGRISISTTHVLQTFAALNQGRPYTDQIKPMNFALTVSVAALGYPIGIDPERFHLLAPFEKNPARWMDMEWTDQYSGRRFTIGIGRSCPPDRVQVRSIRDVILEYRVHPEPKSLGPDGNPCDRATVGLLGRRPVRARERVYIGKESNRLEDVQVGLVHAVGDVRATYRDPREGIWPTVVAPLLRHIPKRELARAARITPRQVQALRNGHGEPSPETARAVIAFARRWARRMARRKTLWPAVRRDVDRFLVRFAGESRPLTVR